MRYVISKTRKPPDFGVRKVRRIESTSARAALLEFMLAHEMGRHKDELAWIASKDVSSPRPEKDVADIYIKGRHYICEPIDGPLYHEPTEREAA